MSRRWTCSSPGSPSRPLLARALRRAAGWLVEALAGGRAAPAPCCRRVGLAAIVVVGQFLTLRRRDRRAGDAGRRGARGRRARRSARSRRRGSPAGWAVAAASRVFAVYAAPIVLSGEATFAGYIKLDDTATWLAFTDQVMEHGRDLDGLAPSSYEATLALNLGEGYPVGVFVPLGVGAALLGEDVAWLVQPYMAFLAALLALALWALARAAGRAPAAAGRGRRRRRPAGAAVRLLPLGRGQGGRGGGAARDRRGAGAASRVERAAELAPGCVPLALVCAGAARGPQRRRRVWLAPALLGRAGARGCAGGSARGRVARARRAGSRLGSRCCRCPCSLAGRPAAADLVAAHRRRRATATCSEPLDPLQVAGIWPAGDFRFDPTPSALAYALIAGRRPGRGGAGCRVAWRRRRWAPVVATSPARCRRGRAIGLVGSPWVDGKALATAVAGRPVRGAASRRALLARAGRGSLGGRRGGAASPRACCGRTRSPTATSTSRRASSSPSSRRSASRSRARARP